LHVDDTSARQANMQAADATRLESSRHVPIMPASTHEMRVLAAEQPGCSSTRIHPGEQALTFKSAGGAFRISMKEMK
jgi:hypothetical protein